MDFGDHFWSECKYNSKHNLEELLNLIDEDITIKVLPFANDYHNKHSIPLFELTDKPSAENIKEMETLHDGYIINFYSNPDDKAKWKYLMHIELPRYYSELNYNLDNVSSTYTVYDKLRSPDKPLAIFPWNDDTGYNAKFLCDSIVGMLNKE